MLLPQNHAAADIAQNTERQTQMFEGGPRFGGKNPSELPQNIMGKIETAHGGGWRDAIGNNSRKLLLTFVALAIIAVVAVFATIVFTGESQNNALVQRTAVSQETAAQQAEETVQITQAEMQQSVLFADGKTGNVILKAKSGEGVTNLARAAISQYLQDTGRTLSAEQRIYSEDFLKDATGSFPLEIGQQVSFSTADVETAYELAVHLTDTQLINLSQYAQNVAF